jgi:mono/diheme cytochrome c family protein
MMLARGRSNRGLAASAFLVAGLLAGAASAQSALDGKRLYHDVGRMRGAGVSCVDCHGGMPGGLHGIGRAAGDRLAVEYAIGAIRQMEPLRGRVTAQDMADIAAYLAAPDVAGPDLRLSSDGPAASPYGGERLEFAETSPGSASPPSTIRLSNAGGIPFRLLSAPKISGVAADDFRLIATDCHAATALAPQQSCTIAVAFDPRGDAPGLRAASVGLEHDWIRGGVNIALIGRVGTAEAAKR